MRKSIDLFVLDLIREFSAAAAAATWMLWHLQYPIHERSRLELEMMEEKEAPDSEFSFTQVQVAKSLVVGKSKTAATSISDSQSIGDWWLKLASSSWLRIPTYRSPCVVTLSEQFTQVSSGKVLCHFSPDFQRVVLIWSVQVNSTDSWSLKVRSWKHAALVE